MTGIILDIDDTLYNRQNLIARAAELALGEKFGELETVEFIENFYRCSDQNLALLEAGKITTIESNAWRYDKVLSERGTWHDGIGLVASQNYARLQAEISVSATIGSTLDELSRCPNVTLGIITAGESAHQWRKYEILGLERWVSRENTIVAGDVGYTKPDVRIFELMSQRLGIEPCNLWMVGDSLRHDIKGASDAGWHTLWFDRRGQGGEAEIIVRNESELAQELIRIAREGNV